MEISPLLYHKWQIFTLIPNCKMTNWLEKIAYIFDSILYIYAMKFWVLFTTLFIVINSIVYSEEKS